MLKPFRLCFTWVLVLLLAGCTQTKNPEQTNAHNPEAALINAQLGIAYLKQGDFQRSKRKLQLALEQDNHSAIVLDAMAYFLEATGQVQAAEKFYQKAIATGHDRGSAQNNYGAFLCRHKHYKEAEVHFLLATRAKDYSTPANAYENAGLCALESQDQEKSEYYFTKALQKEPRSAKSLLKLSQIHYTKRDFVLARQDMDHYLAIYSPTPESLLLGLRIADHLGDTKTVAANTTQLREKFADSGAYQEILATEKSS